MEIILQQNPTPTHRRCDFDSSTKSFFRKEILVWKGLGGKKGRFSTKTKSSGIQGWHHGPKARRISMAGRATEETTSLESHRKSIATKKHIRFFEVSLSASFCVTVSQLRFRQVWSLTQICYVDFSQSRIGVQDGDEGVAVRNGRE